MSTPDFRAFITGSRAYGTPREDSDVDIVIFVGVETRDQLVALFGGPGIAADHKTYPIDDPSIKQGMINLVVISNEEQYRAWREGTAAAKAKAPVTRDCAIKMLRAAGVIDFGLKLEKRK